MAQYQSVRAQTGVQTAAQIDEGLRTHMNKVYGTMSIGMFISGAAAWAIAGLAITSDPSATGMAVREGEYLSSLGALIYTTPLRWVIMLAPLAFLFFGWQRLVQRASASVVQLSFFAFAAFMGLSLSSIFLVYTDFSIVQTFLVTAIAFAALSLWGYTTKTDISGWGTFLFMGVIGILVAMVINIFLQSPVMMYAISFIGILVFAGLTAWETQNTKNTYIAHAHHGDQEWLDKAAYDASLGLYISFLNMFQFLLMFMGQQE